MSNFVSYAWYTSRQSGFGCLEVTSPKDISTIQDIQKISKWLGDEVVKDKHGEKASCVVLSFQRFQGNKDE